MKLQRTFICFAGVFFAVGFGASQAIAGLGTPGCSSGDIFPMIIEVNQIRAGGKTVVTNPSDTTKVTAKARILKGTALPGTTIDPTTLRIEAITDRVTFVCHPLVYLCDPPDAEFDTDPECLLPDHDPEEVIVDVVIGSGVQTNITLGVGKGGKGASIVVDTQECGPSGFITFTAEFIGTDDDGEGCIGKTGDLDSKPDLRKLCR